MNGFSGHLHERFDSLGDALNFNKHHNVPSVTLFDKDWSPLKSFILMDGSYKLVEDDSRNDELPALTENVQSDRNRSESNVITHTETIELELPVNSLEYGLRNTTDESDMDNILCDICKNVVSAEEQLQCENCEAFSHQSCVELTR